MRHRRLNRSVVALGLALLAICLQAQIALAAPAWLAPEPVSEAGLPSRYSVAAMDDSGRALVVWVNETVWASTHEPGGSWSAPTKLVSPASESYATKPVVALNRAGEGVIAWLMYTGTTASILAVDRGADGSLSEPVEVKHVADTETTWIGGVSAAVNASGEAAVAWMLEESGETAAQATTRPSGGAWESPQTVDQRTGTSANLSAVGIDGAGDVTVLFGVQSTVMHTYAAVRPAGESFSSPTLLDEAEEGRDLHLAVDDAGAAVGTWLTEAGGASAAHAFTRTTATGSFSAAASVSSEESYAATVAINVGGEALIGWTHRNGAEETWPEAMTWTPTGGFSAPVALTDAEDFSSGPQVAINDSGEALVGWLSPAEGSNSEIRGARRPAGGAFGAPVTVAGAGVHESGSVALASSGDGVAAWSKRLATTSSVGVGTRAVGGSRVIEAAGLDATPPTLRDLSVPETAQTGVPASFSVRPLDVWGPVSTTFDFGDGAGAAGESVTHAYCAAGTREVKVTATDAAGNAAIAERQVTVRGSGCEAAPSRAGLALMRPTKLVVKDGAVTVKVKNTGSAATSGKLHLWTKAPGLRRGVTGVGNGSFKAAAGAVATVKLRLSAKTLKLLRGKQSHQLAVRASARAGAVHATRKMRLVLR